MLSSEVKNGACADLLDTGERRGFFKKHPMGYLSFAFIIPVVIMYLIYLAMEIHPFGNGSVLVLDLNAQYVYFYEALRNFVYGDAGFLYSFCRGLGGEFLGIYAYYIASPFSYIVCLFPQSMMLDALLTIFLIKVGLCGVTFGFYLHKTGKSKSQIATVIFSCMYALTAYAVVQQHNSMWIDAVIWLPIITYGIEQLIKHGRFRSYVVFLALTLMSNYYIGYMVCIYCLAYFFFYYFAHNEEGRNNPRGERRHFIKSFSRFGLYSLLAAGIAAFMLLAAYYSLTFGKNEFSDPSWDFAFKFDLLDFLTKFLPGSYDTVRPEGLPFVYCGVLTLILVPVYFLSSKFKPREKVMSGALIAFFVLSFVITVTDLVWHGFQRPNWLNYRYSFMLCFFLLTLAAQAFSEIKSISSKAILAVCAAIAGFVVIVQYLDPSFTISGSERFYIKDLETVWMTLACVAAYLILICLLKVSRFKENLLIILAFVVAFELFGNGLSNVVALDRDVIYSKYDGYNDFISAYRPVVNNLLENDPSFYRMEKFTKTPNKNENLSFRKSNDNMALNIRGLTHSTSTLNSDTVRFLSRMGYSARSHWMTYLGGNVVNDSLLGMKYIISNDDYSAYYTKAYDVGAYDTWLNPYALSLAYGVDDRVKDIVSSDYYTPFEYLNALIGAMLGENGPAKIFVPLRIDSIKTGDYCKVMSHATYDYYEKLNDTNDAVVNYFFTPPAGSEVFFYLPYEKYENTFYWTQVALRVNDRPAGSFSVKDSNILSLGRFEAGQQAKLSMTIQTKEGKLFIKSDRYLLYYIDMAAFKNAMSRLSLVQYKIDDFTDSHFTGSITSERNAQMIQTTLAYDEGWRVYVDGKRVKTFETLDALVAFHIDDAGSHTLELRYMPDSYVLGGIITVASIIILIFLFVIHRALLIKPPRLAVSGDEGDDPLLLTGGVEEGVIADDAPDEDGSAHLEETVGAEEGGATGMSVGAEESGVAKDLIFVSDDNEEIIVRTADRAVALRLPSSEDGHDVKTDIELIDDAVVSTIRQGDNVSKITLRQDGGDVKITISSNNISAGGEK